MGSKKRKGSTATKAAVHQAHKERTDIDVDGSIAGSACVIDTAAIEGAKATDNSTIEVNVTNSTNVAAASNAIAATAAAAGNVVAATAAAAGDAVAATVATAGNIADNARTADAATIEGANAAGNLPLRLTLRTPQTWPPLSFLSQPLWLPLAMVSRSPLT
jgi:hypothetical protein